MGKLDGIDFAQMIGLILALVIGFLPTVLSIRTKENRINKLGFALISIFMVTLLITVFATLSKSVSDKNEYKSLFDSTKATLLKVNSNLNQSNEIIKFQDLSIQKLSNMQINVNGIITQGDSINTKAVSISEQLQHELKLQQILTAKTSDIFDKIMTQKSELDHYNNLRFIMCYSSLFNANYILYYGLQKTDINVSNWFEIMRKNYSSDSLTYSKVVNIVSDSIKKLILIKLENTQKNYAFTVIDIPQVSEAIKRFFENTLLLMNNQMTNSFLLNNKKLFKLWFDYYSSLYVKQNVFFLDKESFCNIETMKELIINHEQFLKEIQNDVNLNIALPYPK